jgi:hypothetical protein
VGAHRKTGPAPFEPNSIAVVRNSPGMQSVLSPLWPNADALDEPDNANAAYYACITRGVGSFSTVPNIQSLVCSAAAKVHQ